MKKLILIAAFSLVAAQASAGLSSFDSSEFNSIIKENAETENHLQKELLHNAHVVQNENRLNLKEKLAQSEKESSLYAVGSEDNVVVPESKNLYKDHSRSLSAAPQKSMQRINAEVRQATTESNF